MICAGICLVPGTKSFRAALVLSILPPAASWAELCPENSPSSATSAQELAKEKHNPFADQITLPIQVSSGLEVGPGNGTSGGLNIQPALPISLSEEWKVILRPGLSLLVSEQPHRKLGLSDLELQSYLTPMRADKWIWGAGPVLQAPTATETFFGTGKWSAGPGVGLIYMSGPWVNGILANHVWSFAGDEGRDAVSQSTFEPTISYSFESGWYISIDSAITADWNAASDHRWTVPVGLDVGKTFEMGRHSLSLQLGAYYNVARAEEVERWLIRFQISFVFPKAASGK